MMVVYALRSASRFAGAFGDSTRRGWPPESITLGKRTGLDLTQLGVQSMAPFFHVPNQSSTARNPCARVERRIWSNAVKSKRPSSASITFQYTGYSTVLACIALNLGHASSIRSGKALKLPT